MNRRPFPALLACAALLGAAALSGCAAMLGLEGDRPGPAEQRMAARIDTLQARIDSLQAELVRVSRRNQADMASLQRSMLESNEAIAARIEENTHALRQGGAPAASAPAAAKKPAAGPKAPSAIASAPAAAPAPADAESERLYNAARADFNAQRFQEAYNEFKTVYEQAPEGRRAEDALYWMGLCFEKTDRLDNALTVYGMMLDQFPNGRKSCSARFRMAKIAETRGQNEERLNQLRALAGEPACASTNEGRRAAEMLK